MGKKSVFYIISIVAILIILCIVMMTKAPNKEKNEDINKSSKEEYVTILSDGTKLNISKEINKEREFDGLKITNVQLSYTNGNTTLLADIENTNVEKTDLKGIKVQMLDKEGVVIAEAKGLIPSIGVKEKSKLSINIAMDCSNAYDFVIIYQ